MKATPATIARQREYFTGTGRTARIALGATPCVRRHFAETVDPLGLRPGARVLEVGCGMGRFTALLLDRKYEVTALDLSPYLIDRLQTALGSTGRLTTVAGRAEDVPDLVSGPFDAAVGFFFLHHLRGFDETFAGIRQVLSNDGQVAFCEPNAFNPLVYLQVTFTPGMSWSGEPSIPRMRPGAVFPPLARAGFSGLETAVYGALPPVVANTSLGGRAERLIERVAPLRRLGAYRIFRGRAAGVPRPVP